MSYRIALSFNNFTEELVIPVLPASFEVSDGVKGSTFEVVGLGEINVIKERKLSEYGFSSFFPGQPYPFVYEVKKDQQGKEYLEPEWKPPMELVLKISRWMQSKRPIRLIVDSGNEGQAGMVYNTPASIESFTWKETAGGTGDIEYTIKMKHYVFHAARKVTIKDNKASTAKAQRPDEREKPKTYVMVAGDSLWKVAQTQLGSGARWGEIQKLNGIPDAELRRLPIGKVLKLP
ncbi:LysM peptidoglycan-binding domain-containing protein [Paenibacillus sp. CAU 1782]